MVPGDGKLDLLADGKEKACSRETRAIYRAA